LSPPEFGCTDSLRLVENYPSIQEAQAKLLEPLPPAKTSETAAVSVESSESQMGDRLNKPALQNAILL
jgi:hypothetical protein